VTHRQGESPPRVPFAGVGRSKRYGRYLVE
jgi:hypothetical protein